MNKVLYLTAMKNNKSYIHKFLFIYISVIFLSACQPKQNTTDSNQIIQEEENKTKEEIQYQQEHDTVIIDSQYTFAEALHGSDAPQDIIDELMLIDVTYLSTDKKIHQGQILTNKRLVDDLQEMFQFMLNQEFVIEKAIPIVAFNWSDSISMANNNTYSFCYRNISYSKHAKGLAIDINPRFNPLRWKNRDLPNEPHGAVLDTTVNGTLHPQHVVVKEFQKHGFRWGHTFTKYWDDHHFERR